MKVKLTTLDIINKEFQANVKGYKAIEVDEFLDEIVKDYESFEQDLLELRQKNDALVSANDKAKKKIAELEANNAILLAKVKNIKDNSKVSLENIDLLNRIKSLENALYKAGINPTKIK